MDSLLKTPFYGQSGGDYDHSTKTIEIVVNFVQYFGIWKFSTISFFFVPFTFSSHFCD